MSVEQMTIWNLADSAAILKALQLVNVHELKVAICISPKKMAFCDFYSFVMFFYLFAMFSQRANLLLNDIVSQYLALTKIRGYTV